MSAATITSFAPIADAQATRLILGSMPGSASLAAGEYYAHRHNAFWPIMASVNGFAPDAAYSLRVDALQRASVAVWDVLQSCERRGSLDAAIVRASEVVNDFATFFAAHPAIRQVFFNGAAAELSFKRHCASLLREPGRSFTRLPSTSPAHASLGFAQKCAAWTAALGE